MTEESGTSRLIPDIDGFEVNNFYSGEFSGLISTKRLTDRVLSVHTLRQMIAAQQTGESIGFLVYSRSSANIIGGEKKKWNAPHNESSIIGTDTDGNEYVVVKVSLPKKVISLRIASVTVMSRDEDGIPTEENWSAVGEFSYMVEGSGHYGVRRQEVDTYIIQHSNGITRIGEPLTK